MTPDITSILESIDTKMSDQVKLLRDMKELEAETLRDRMRMHAFGALSGTGHLIKSSLSGAGDAIAGVGKGIEGAGSGIGSILGGLGGLIGKGGLGLAAIMVAGGMIDARKIKENVLTLLSIPDEAGGSLEMLMDGGEIGLALWGLGQALMKFGLGSGVNAAVDYFNGDWAEGVKSSIETLLSIDLGQGVEQAATILKGGALSAIMYALGQGMIVFGAGSAINTAVDYFNGDWAEGVKSSIETLLSIDLGGGALGAAASILKGGALTIVMGELSAGLIAFGAGAGVIAAVDLFAKNDWAEAVKRNVETLLSISEIEGVLWDATKFVGVMGLIGGGLAAFALGKGVEGVSEGMDEALSMFTEQQGFAERIKSEVQTLLSISQLDGVGADTAQFIATMGGIGLGLAAFALGKGAEGVVEGMDEAIAYFTEDQGFAERIKTQVMTLLSIPSLADPNAAESFSNVMGSLSLGLMKFAGGNLVGSLANATEAIIGFFTGSESPFEQIRLIASDADNLMKAADAIDKIAGALEKFGSIDVAVDKIDFTQLAENLGEAIPLLDALANGGHVEGSEGWLTNGLTFPKGILDPTLRLDEMADAIARVNYVLGQSTVYPVNIAPTANIGARTGAIENAAIASNIAGTGGAVSYAPTSVNTGGNVTNAPTTYNTVVNPHTGLDTPAYLLGGP